MSGRTEIKLDGLTVTVSIDGEERQRWEPRAIVYAYNVWVEDGTTEYECRAWGSAHDHDQNVTDSEGIGWMVLDELLSAAYDPDEFWTTAIGAEPPSRERVEEITNVLDKAAAMMAALERNEDAINEHR